MAITMNLSNRHLMTRDIGGKSIVLDLGQRASVVRKKPGYLVVGWGNEQIQLRETPQLSKL